jgi:hypothetical protein
MKLTVRQSEQEVIGELRLVEYESVDIEVVTGPNAAFVLMYSLMARPSDHLR